MSLSKGKKWQCLLQFVKNELRKRLKKKKPVKIELSSKNFKNYTALIW